MQKKQVNDGVAKRKSPRYETFLEGEQKKGKKKNLEVKAKLKAVKSPRKEVGST